MRECAERVFRSNTVGADRLPDERRLDNCFSSTGGGEPLSARCDDAARQQIGDLDRGVAMFVQDRFGMLAQGR